MPNRAVKFVDNFTKAIDLIMQEAPRDLSICISIYARDASDRTETEPDGRMSMTSAMRCGYFDKVTFAEYVKEFFCSNDHHNPMD